MSSHELLEALSNDIGSLTTGQRMSGALRTTLLSMGIVFVILIFLILIIKLMGKVAGTEKNNQSKQAAAPVAAAAPKVVEDEDEIVAVITAAVYEALGDTSLKLHIKK